MLTCACVLVAWALPAFADEPIPDSATISAKVQAANGPVPSNYRDVIEETQSNGVIVRVTHYVDGQSYRYDRVSGPIETQTGSYKGDAWHQDDNGFTVVHELPPGLATPDTFTTTVTRIVTPVTGYRIAHLNSAGLGTVEYVDASTWQVVRSESIDFAGTSVTSYGPRVTFGAMHLPKTWHTHSVDAALDEDFTRVSYDAGLVTDADIEMPPNRRELVEFPAGVDTVTLPTVFAKSGHIFVRATVDGVGYDFLLDSGASQITVDPAAALKMHLTPFNKMQNAANAGRVDTALAKIQLIAVGTLTMHDVFVHEIPMWDEGDVKIVGTMGFDFLAGIGVQIDYDNKRVVVHKVGSYDLEATKETNVIPIRLDTQQPLVTASINGAIAERILLDTGGAGTFLLFDYFARRHPEALVDNMSGGANSRPRIFRGVGGVFSTKTYQLKEIDLGSVRYKNFLGQVVTSKSYGGAKDGLLGADFLRVYDLFLDYPHGQIGLTLNETGRHAAGK
jgi:hypothetical protein